MNKDSLYTATVKITEEFLGPAGERFIRRQITTHLAIEPETINKNHLAKLIDWISIAFALLSNDASELNSYTKKLRTLSHEGHTVS